MRYHLTTHVLLQLENPAIAGFQRPTLGPVRNFDVVSGELVQILRTGSVLAQLDVSG